MTTYKKLPVEEVEAQFAKCRADPSMRSVTAVLRITREQVGARGFLWQYPRIAALMAVLALILGVVAMFLPSEARPKILPIAIGSGALAVLLTAGAIAGANDRKHAVEQEVRLRRSAADTLEDLLAHPFARKGLDREHVDTLRELSKSSLNHPRLKAFWVEVSGA